MDCCTESCCNGGSVTVNATGEMAEKCPECLGEFEVSLGTSGKPVYSNKQGELLMYFNNYWAVFTGRQYEKFESAVTEADCPADVTTWKYYKYGSFSNPGTDAPMTVTCT